MLQNQIILGSGGSVGNALAKELTKYSDTIYLYSRNPKKVNDDDILIQGNLLNKEQTTAALKGMDIAYLMVGLPYNSKIWERDFLKIVLNVVDACKFHKVPLVFFDNVYMYDSEQFFNLVEQTPIKDRGRKGTVRAIIARTLLSQIKKNDINILIARAADLYGKDTKNSMFNNQVIKRIFEGKKANWLIDADKKHALTLTSDAAKAIALLGNSHHAYNQVWHLPTDKAYTANELVAKIGTLTKETAKLSIISSAMVKFLGIFISGLKESQELLYQFESDYIFNSSKFEKEFFKPTPIDEGLKELIDTIHNNKQN